MREKGIQPLTPEGRQEDSSYWTSGIELFGKGAKGYDSTFFHWGHTADLSDPEHTYMTIALTNDASLRGIHPDFSRSRGDYFEVGFPVPREQMHLLRVEVDHGETNWEPREYGKIAEQLMFDLIEDALTNGYDLGRETVRKVQLSGEGREIAGSAAI